MTSAPLPPQDLDAEESIIGAMMISPGAIEAVADLVDASDFYRGSHGLIYAAAMALYHEGSPVDAITVTAKLEEQAAVADAGGAKRVHELAALVPTASNAAHYARIVRDRATRRGLMAAAAAIHAAAADGEGSTTDIVAEAERLVFDASRHRVRSDILPIGDGLAEAIKRFQELAELGSDVVGLPSGLAALDAMTSGLHPGNLVVVGARPSMGKTAFAMGVAAHTSFELGRPSLMFTLEMSRQEVLQRYVSSEARVDGLKLRSGRLPAEAWPKIMKAGTRIHDAPLYVEDIASLTMTDIRVRARRFASRHPDLALVVVDYLQLMTSGTRAENRVQEVSQISRSLKVLAAELQVPVIAVSQLNRQVEQRHDKRPILPDLRESGQVEQDADIILFLYRDAYYNPEDAIQDGTEGVAELNIAKHRNGPTGTVKIAFVKQYASFSDLA